MMRLDGFVLRGGRRLAGRVRVSGSKNAALPCLFATLLTDDPCELTNVPDLQDIRTAVRLLERLGKKVSFQRGTVTVRRRGALQHKAPYDLVRRMRASAVVLGPLLARLGRAHVSLPGGCAIGARPINFHLKAFEALGAKVTVQEGYVAAAGRLRGKTLRLPFASVGATENVMMAAALARGRTVLKNAAREPEITDLADMLLGMGARVSGAGTSTIVIDGVDRLGGVNHRVIPDRIEAGTLLIDRGAVTVAGGLTVDTVRVGLFSDAVSNSGSATLTVSGGAVSIGTGATGNHFDVARREANNGSVDAFSALADFTNASSVTINVDQLRVATLNDAATSGASGVATGELRLSAAGAN
ncbi:MAG TPA: UDP-N-acetylglucosamine 1-carboxyvinyltransferase, partial [Elusimicrobiota bacterium]|nr:UDP-N-acetylglucosamine 1-carboxyvinyltransferase [Elusimicrobiota bacterium]